MVSNKELQVFNYIETLAPEVRGCRKVCYFWLTPMATGQINVAGQVGSREDTFFSGAVSGVDRDGYLRLLCVLSRPCYLPFTIFFRQLRWCSTARLL